MAMAQMERDSSAVQIQKEENSQAHHPHTAAAASARHDIGPSNYVAVDMEPEPQAVQAVPRPIFMDLSSREAERIVQSLFAAQGDEAGFLSALLQLCVAEINAQRNPAAYNMPVGCPVEAYCQFFGKPLDQVMQNQLPLLSAEDEFFRIPPGGSVAVSGGTLPAPSGCILRRQGIFVLLGDDLGKNDLSEQQRQFIQECLGRIATLFDVVTDMFKVVNSRVAIAADGIINKYKEHWNSTVQTLLETPHYNHKEASAKGFLGHMNGFFWKKLTGKTMADLSTDRGYAERTHFMKNIPNHHGVAASMYLQSHIELRLSLLNRNAANLSKAQYRKQAKAAAQAAASRVVGDYEDMGLVDAEDREAMLLNPPLAAPMQFKVIEEPNRTVSRPRLR